MIKQGIKSVDNSLLEKAAERIKKVSSAGKKIIIAGNGGSAAMASHVSVDFTKVARIRAINFNEADLLTCFANDYGYENVFKKAIDCYGDDNDLVILISSSGNSANVINAANHAKKLNIGVITFTGFERNNALRKLGDINIWVDSKAYNIVEMTHHIWLLAIVDFIFGKTTYEAS